MLPMNKKILIAVFMALPAVGMAKPGDMVMNTVNQGLDVFDSIQGTTSQAAHLLGDTLAAPIKAGVDMYDAIQGVPATAAHSLGSTITSTVTGLQSVGDSTAATVKKAEGFIPAPLPVSSH